MVVGSGFNSDRKNAELEYGDVKVSTGILQCDKRVEMGNLFNNPHFKLNANENVALAA